jgi:hypothetical protein
MQKECTRSKLNPLWLGCGPFRFQNVQILSQIDVAWLQFSSRGASHSPIILILSKWIVPVQFLFVTEAWMPIPIFRYYLFFPHSVTWNQTRVQLLDTKEHNRSMILLGCSNCGSISSRYYHHYLACLKFSSQVQAENATMDLYRSNTLLPLSLDALSGNYILYNRVPTLSI